MWFLNSRHWTALPILWSWEVLIAKCLSQEMPLGDNSPLISKSFIKSGKKFKINFGFQYDFWFTWYIFKMTRHSNAICMCHRRRRQSELLMLKFCPWYFYDKNRLLVSCDRAQLALWSWRLNNLEHSSVHCQTCEQLTPLRYTSTSARKCKQKNK